MRSFDHLHRHSIKQHTYGREHCHSYLSSSIGPPTPPLRSLQYVPRTINTNSQTTSVSLRRPTPPFKHKVHAYYYKRYHSCLERPYTIAPALRPPGRLWDQTHTPSSINKRHHSDIYCAYRTTKTPHIVDDLRA